MLQTVKHIYQPPYGFQVYLKDHETGLWKYHSTIKRNVVEEKQRKFLFFKWREKIYESDEDFRRRSHHHALQIMKENPGISIKMNEDFQGQCQGVFWISGHWVD